MALRFTIIDYTTDFTGISTVVDEPVGWDGTAMRLKRDKTWHGFFDFFDDSYSSMQWHNEAGAILKAAYELQGVEAHCELLVEYACSETDDYETIYSGKFVFARYSFICGDMCYALCGVENANCLLTFKNRIDQKVDLDALQSFDEECFLIAEDVIVNFTTPGTIDFPTILIVDLTGKRIVISGSDSNDGVYTVLTFSNGGGFCTITVDPTTIIEADQTITVKSYCLPAYDGLGKEVILPSKTIEYTDDWQIDNKEIDYTDDVLTSETPGTTAVYLFPFDWHLQNISDIPVSNPNADIFSGLSGVYDNMLLEYDGIVAFELSQTLDCSGEVDLSIEMEGTSELNSTSTVQWNGSIIIYHEKKDGTTIDYLLQGGLGCAGCNSTSDAISISWTDTWNVEKGDRIYLLYVVAGMQYTTSVTTGFNLKINIDSARLIIKAATKCEATPAKLYMVNEVLSRITEAYTADCLRVKSDYFGRTNSQPYTSAENGDGGLEAVTSGLHIRAKDTNKVPIGGTLVTPKLTLSMKQMFESLHAIHNIGMGIEPDSVRGGSAEWIRIEPIEYFYNDTVLMTCTNIREVTREFDITKVFSMANIGYSKWETENVNGLNDVFGKREYRTSLKAQKGDYSKIAQFIASDYAIEVTRRQFGSSTKDWKYDNDTFIICLTDVLVAEVEFFDTNKMKFGVDAISLSQIQIGDTLTITGTASNDGTYTVTNVAALLIQFSTSITNETVTAIIQSSALTAVQQGVSSATNILYPNDAYNLFLTPARNALRHLKTVFQSYVDATNGKLIFTAGDGNFIAVIDLDDYYPVLEDGSLAENKDLQASDLVDPTKAYPLFKPELVKYEYPVTWDEYLAIRANPYGLIGFQCNDEAVEYGWIEDFKLLPYTGLAEFTLKPKTAY